MRITTSTVDSPLGRWTHSQCRPARLAHVVDHLWHFDGRTTLPRERIFPGAFLEVILHLGPRFSDVDASGATIGEFPLACLTGIQTKPAVIEAPAERCCVLGIRLRPVGAYAVFGAVLNATPGITVDLRDAAGADATDLAEQCYDAATVEERFTHVMRWISDRVARTASHSPHAAVAWTAERLEQSDGVESIAHLRERTGLSGPRFVELFRQHTGLTPKRYAKILRFHRALSMLKLGTRLSEVAASAGYFDQSHLNAEFREFAGMTPTAFLRAAGYPGSLSLQEAG